MQSDASSGSKQREPIVLFLDRSLGKKHVARKLREGTPASIEIHDDHFSANATDEHILGKIGKKGRLFLTKDKRIRYSGLAQSAIRNTKAGVFFLSTRGDMQGKEMADIFLKAFPRICQFVNLNAPPFMAKITREGKLRKVDWK